MTTAMKGMDTEAGVAASAELDQGSQRIVELATRLDNALRSFDWTGTDAERTFDSWASTERPALDSSSAQLAQMALLIRQEAQAQDTVSGESAGTTTAGSSAPANGGSPKGFLAKVGDFISTRVDAAINGLGRTLGHAGDFLGKVGDVLTGRENHSVSEIAASAIATMGSAVGTVVDVVDGKDSNWFGEGTGVAGTPSVVPTAPGTGGDFSPVLTRPTDLGGLMQGVTDSYQVGKNPDVPGGDVRITRVDNGSGPAYVVSIPGTETWTPSAGAEPRDLSANLGLVAGNPTAAAESVRAAMAAAHIPPGSPVMLIGHSQGGIIAGQLASDPDFVRQYGITNVLTYGAPIDHMQLAPGVEALQVQHRFDLVPRLDLGGVALDGANPNSPVTAVTLDSPGGVFGVVTNHDHTAYINSVRGAMDGDSEAGRILRDYQSTLAPFLVTPTGSATAIDVPVTREPRQP